MIMTEKLNHATHLTDLTQLGHYMWQQIKIKFETRPVIRGPQDKD